MIHQACSFIFNILGVVSSSTGAAAAGVSTRDDHSPVPQCSSSGFACHSSFAGDEIENSEESEFFAAETGSNNGGSGASYRYSRNSTPNGRERKRVLR